METPPLYEITHGVYKGKIGPKIRETARFVKIQIDAEVIQCKKEFARIYKLADIQLEQQMRMDQEIAQELERIQQEAIKKGDKQRCAEQTAMIAEQNRAYEESLNVDLQKAASQQLHGPEPEFEEVSLEEMRRVRLLRFQQ